MGISSLPRAIPGDEVAGGKCWGKSVRGREGEVCAFCQQYLMKRKIVQAYQGKTTTLIQAFVPMAFWHLKSVMKLFPDGFEAEQVALTLQQGCYQFVINFTKNGKLPNSQKD